MTDTADAKPTRAPSRAMVTVAPPPVTRPSGKLAPLELGLAAVGAIAVGALAIGALAIGQMAIGRLFVGRARMGRVEIGDLIVRRLTVVDVVDEG